MKVEANKREPNVDIIAAKLKRTAAHRTLFCEVNTTQAVLQEFPWLTIPKFVSSFGV
jgi:hypothetical protein